MSNYYDPGTGDYLVVDGMIVERDALAIAERLKEYDPNLELMCLDSDMNFHDLSDAPFVVCCRRPDGSLYKIFEAWSLDERVIERVAMADGSRTNLLDKLASLEQAKQKEVQDRYQEKHLENTDKFTHALRSPKHTYTLHNSEEELVRIHSDKPSTRVSSEKTITFGEKKSNGRSRF
jgi:hypothetical protein